MVYLIIVLSLLAVAAGVLVWQLWVARRALAQSRAECAGMRQDHAIRENLQKILDRREEQLRRLRVKVRQAEDRAAEMEAKISELSLSLFHESGLRILAEKEDGARRMKQDLMERQLLDAQRQLRTERAESVAAQKKLQEIIADLQKQVDAFTVQQGRRARRAVRIPEQVTMEEVMGEGNKNSECGIRNAE